MAEATIFDLTHPGWRDEEIKRLTLRIEELEAELWHERALRGAWQEAAGKVLASRQSK